MILAYGRRRQGSCRFSGTALASSIRPTHSITATSKAKCLIVDVQLGDISGVELARELADAGFTFPIIFMTSADDEANRSRAEQLGCVAYLRKPFSAGLLIEAIVRAIGRPS
jgi:FixJ family two-component response regulator